MISTQQGASPAVINSIPTVVIDAETANSEADNKVRLTLLHVIYIRF